MQYGMTKRDRRQRGRATACSLVLLIATLGLAGAASAENDGNGGPLCIAQGQSLAMGEGTHDDDGEATDDRDEQATDDRDEQATDDRDERDDGPNANVPNPGLVTGNPLAADDDETMEADPDAPFGAEPADEFADAAETRLEDIETRLEAAEEANAERRDDQGVSAEVRDDTQMRRDQLEELRTRYTVLEQQLRLVDEQRPESLAAVQAQIDAELTQLEEALSRVTGPREPGEMPRTNDDQTPPSY